MTIQWRWFDGCLGQWGRMIAGLLVLVWTLGVQAQTGAAPEYAVKSALLFKLPQFVYTGAAERGGDLDVCVLGSNPFGASLDRLAQQTVDGRKFAVKRLATPGEAEGCDFLFIARSESVVLESVLRRVGKWPLVTVSDIEGFAQAGGMVEMALSGSGSSIQLFINRKAAQKQGVEFNAQLLRLAKVVEP